METSGSRVARVARTGSKAWTETVPRAKAAHRHRCRCWRPVEEGVARRQRACSKGRARAPDWAKTDPRGAVVPESRPRSAGSVPQRPREFTPAADPAEQAAAQPARRGTRHRCSKPASRSPGTAAGRCSRSCTRLPSWSRCAVRSAFGDKIDGSEACGREHRPWGTLASRTRTFGAGSSVWIDRGECWTCSGRGIRSLREGLWIGRKGQRRAAALFGQGPDHAAAPAA